MKGKFPSQRRIELFKKVIKSYSIKEKALSGLLIMVVLVTGWRSVTGNWRNQDLKTLIQGGYNYNEGMVGSISHINPVYAELNEVDRDISSLVFSGLSRYNPETRSFEEDIASHNLSTDKTRYTFMINEGQTWHDGTPVTAEDVYFTYHDVIQNPEFENPILRNNFAGVTIELVDDQTVTMELDEPNAFFFTQVTVGILPKHILGEVPVNELDSHEFNKMPIGNGPFKVTKPYEVNSKGVSKVELQYRNQETSNAEKPDITQVNFIVYPNQEALFNNLGEVHGVARLEGSQLETINKTERFIEYAYSLPQYSALFLNTESQYLGTRDIRLAIQKAIDKDEIVGTIEHVQRIDTPLLELDQDDWINQTSVENAAGALFDNGWTLEEGETIRTNEEGERLSLTLVRQTYSSNENQEKITTQTAEMIQTQLEKVGIEVVIESYEGEAFQQRVQNREYDLLLYGQSLGYNLDTYAYWHSSQADGKGLNLSNYTNAKADFQIEALRNTPKESDEEREAYLKNLAEIIKEDIPAVFLYRPRYYFIADKKIENIRTSNLLFPLDRFSNIIDWKIQ